MYSRILGIITGKPVVHTFHGFHYKHLLLFHRLLYLNLERLLAKCTDVFINVSDSEKKVCCNVNVVSNGRVVVIPNGVIIPAFRKREIPKKKWTLVNVSRLSPEKGVDMLLDIMKLLSLQFTGFRLVVVGDGAERAYLERKAHEIGIDEHVLFTGFRQDVANILASADIYVTATKGEGMSLTVLEAMAESLPVVASKVVGIVDLLVQGENGFMFNINRPEEAAAYLLRLVYEKSLYERMSKNAYQTVSGKHSVARMCAEVSKIYNAF